MLLKVVLLIYYLGVLYQIWLDSQLRKAMMIMIKLQALLKSCYIYSYNKIAMPWLYINILIVFTPRNS